MSLLNLINTCGGVVNLRLFVTNIKQRSEKKSLTASLIVSILTLHFFLLFTLLGMLKHSGEQCKWHFTKNRGHFDVTTCC